MNQTVTTPESGAQDKPLLKPYARDPQLENHLADNPRHTVMLLLQGAVDKANLAKVCHQSGAWVEKGFHLGRLTTIVDALRDRLHFTQDTPLAYDLEELYRYVDQCVQEAVFEKDTFYLDAAQEILTELRDAWVDMLVSVGELQLDEQ